MKILVFYCLCFLLLVNQLNIQAQENLKINVSGMVTDSLYKPLEFATVQLVSLDEDMLVFGGITINDGTYSIKNLSPNKYQLIVSSVGYKSFSKEVDLTKSKKKASLGLHKLNPDVYSLDDIDVKVERTGLNMKANKMIFIPDSITLKSAKTGIDVVNKIPEVKIDKKDQTVSVLGNKNVLVLINGIDNNRNIVSIHPNDIERIEVISHPSVKYRSDIASVINIVLKGFKEKGIVVSSNVYYCVDKKNHTGNVQIDYNWGKLNLFTAYNGNLQNTLSADSVFRIDKNKDVEQKYLSFPLSDNDVDLGRHNIKYGIDYNINKRNILSFSSSVLLQDLESHRNYAIKNFVNDNFINESRINSKYINDKEEQNYSLFFLHKFLNDEDKLTIQSNFYNLSKCSFHTINNIADYFNSINTSRKRLTKGFYAQNSTNNKIDYTRSVGKNLFFETGYQFYNRNIENEILSTNIEGSVVNYSDSRNSIYINGSFNKNKFNFQSGLRIENYNIKVNGSDNNQTVFLPYGSVFFKLNTNNSFKVVSRKSLEYPVYSYLNPFKYYSSDSLSYYSGNPNLKPEQRNTINLKYSHKKKSNHWSISFAYDMSKNHIVQSAVKQNDVVAYVYNNIGKANHYNSVFSMSSVLLNWAEIEVLLRGGYTNYLTKKSHNGFSYAAEFGLYMPLFGGFDLELYGVFNEKVIDYNGYSEYGGYIEEILLTKDVAKNIFIGFAIWQPLFNVNDKDRQWNKSFNEISKHSELRSTSYLINITYYFKKGKKSNKIKKSSIMESNQSKGKMAR